MTKSTLLKQWHVYEYGALQERCAEIGSGDYLIEQLVPSKSLVLDVGDSGVGKSPKLYQASLCIASGKPFLGHAVRKGTVLYLDFENGLGQVEQIIGQLLKHLKLQKAPRGLKLWNVNDSSESWDLEDMIKEVDPDLVIIDSLTALYPDIEDKNSTATEIYQEFRRLMRTYNTSILGVHHLKKPSEKAKVPCLEDDDWRSWFLQARGARVLINGCDVRLGVDLPRRRFKKDAALVMRGFERVRGEIPLMYLNRVLDEDGDPLGYEKMKGVAMLANVEMEGTFRQLPQIFRHKDAKTAYAKASQATTNFLNKCIGCEILRKNSDGTYEKTDEDLRKVA